MVDKYFILDSSGFPKEVAGIELYAGGAAAGKLVALGSDGKIDNSLVNFSSGGGGETSYTKRVDEVSIDIIYVGAAEPGSSESSPVWQIFKADFTGSSVSKKYADGTSAFTKIWTDRLTYTYT